MNKFSQQLDQLERDEAWLAGIDSPALSAQAARRIKRAMLAARPARLTASRRPLWSHPVTGFWAAAAIILLCVGLGLRSHIHSARPMQFAAVSMPAAADAVFDDSADVEWNVLAGELSGLTESNGLMAMDQSIDGLQDAMLEIEAQGAQLWDSNDESDT